MLEKSCLNCINYTGNKYCNLNPIPVQVTPEHWCGQFNPNTDKPVAPVYTRYHAGDWVNRDNNIHRVILTTGLVMHNKTQTIRYTFTNGDRPFCLENCNRNKDNGKPTVEWYPTLKEAKINADRLLEKMNLGYL